MGRQLCFLLLCVATCSTEAGSICDNEKYGTTLCDGTYRGESISFPLHLDPPISGTVPRQLGNLSQLTSVSMDFVKYRYRESLVSGTLPSELALLTNLTTLTIGAYQATSFDLYLNSTRYYRPEPLKPSISGTIPPGLFKLSNIGRLDLVGDFSGTLPSNIIMAASYLYTYTHSDGTGYAYQQDSKLRINSPYLSGTLPDSFGELRDLDLYFGDNGNMPSDRPSPLWADFDRMSAISGTIPSSWGNQKLTRLSLSNLKLSGTLPASFGNAASSVKISRSSMAYSMYNSSNFNSPIPRISGTLPSELMDLPRLYHLDLSHHALSGAIPDDTSFGTREYYSLYLNGNQFDLAQQPRQLISTCISSMKKCAGLPPTSCGAFGPRARLSAAQIGVCFQCPESIAPPILLLIFCCVATVVCARLYFRLVEKCPDAKGWIATSSIIISQLNITSIVGLLQSTEGSTAREVAKVPSLLFFDFSIASPECIFPQGIGMTYIAPSVIIGTPLLILGAMASAKWFFSRRLFCNAWKRAGGCCGCARCRCGPMGVAMRQSSRAGFASQSTIIIKFGKEVDKPKPWVWKFPLRYLSTSFPSAYTAQVAHRTHLKGMLSALGMEVNHNLNEDLAPPLREPYPRRLGNSVFNPFHWIFLGLWGLMTLTWVLCAVPMVYLLPLPIYSRFILSKHLSGEAHRKTKRIVDAVFLIVLPVEFALYTSFVLVQATFGALTFYPPNAKEFILAFDAFVEMTHQAVGVDSPRGAFKSRAAAETTPDPHSTPCSTQPSLQLGCVITQVVPSLPAASAGCQVGDRVIKVNGKDTSAPKEMLATLDALGSDAEVFLTVKRRVQGASDEDLAYALQQEQVDKLEDKMVMLYALLFGTMVKVASQLTLLGAAALALGLSLFSLQAYYTFYLWRNAISLRFADLPEHESPWYVRCMRSSLPKARQELRLRYVVSKYAPHGAHWQFVIWLRQCVMLLVELYVGEAKNPLLQAGLVGGVLAIWGVWQRKVRPFAEQVTLPRFSMSQNTLEEGLLLFNIVAISLGMVYHAARDTVGQYVVDAFMSLGIILALLLMGTILVHGSLQFMRGLSKSVSKPTVTQPTLVKQTEMYAYRL